MLILLGKSPAVEQLGCEVGECLAVADTVNSDGINLCAVLLTFLGVFFFFYDIEVTSVHKALDWCGR